MGRGWVGDGGVGVGEGSMVGSSFFFVSQDPEVFFHLSVCGVLPKSMVHGTQIGEICR
jgi:hypothetical protein